MKRRVNIAEEYATAQRALGLTEPHSDTVCLLGARDAASNQNQESTRVNRSTAEQCDRCAFDHDVTRQDSGGDIFEFQ
jgi:hypothetical protein